MPSPKKPVHHNPSPPAYDPRGIAPTTPPVAANDPIPPYQFGLAEIEGHPRIRDTDLAERLGFDRPRKIRELIERNLSEIEAFGVCPAVGQTSGPRGGRPAREFYLNEEQALLVAVLSNAPHASSVRSALIRTFVAYRRGLLVQGLDDQALELLRRTDGIARMLSRKVTEIEKAMPALRSEFLTALVESDPRVVATTYKPALDVLSERGVPTKGRRGFSQRVSSRLRRFSLDRQIPMRSSHETKRWLFHVDAIAAWIQAEGDAMIRDHIAKVQGQGRLQLVRG